MNGDRVKPEEGDDLNLYVLTRLGAMRVTSDGGSAQGPFGQCEKVCKSTV